ncbi:CD276 antigen-like isoform X1 [Osmerus mordax]|uniref:CD276 antigen-like isoform X1 n=2 Tax=Osmerus mordax TaxID=8014 RepID=UPI00350EFE17
MKLNNRHIFCCLHVALSVAFQVRTPESTVVGAYGGPVVLGCVFPSMEPGLPVDPGLVVTWQTQGDSRVLHSYYHGTDQLDRQSREYHNRTRLYHSELRVGNASLMLERVRLEDEGRYICSISTKDGVGRAEVQLTYAAFYNEPCLTIQAHPNSVTFVYESKGYPEPQVQWTDPLGHSLDFKTTVSSRQPGLLSLRTQLVVQQGGAVNYTFSLGNPLLKQVIRRPVAYVPSRSDMDQNRHRFTGLLPVFAGLLLVF